MAAEIRRVPKALPRPGLESRLEETVLEVAATEGLIVTFGAGAWREVGLESSRWRLERPLSECTGFVRPAS